jgi:hypothetical protein
MNVSLDDFRKHFELLSDDALLETNRDELVPTAQQCYDAEVARRGLKTPEAEAEDPEVLPSPEPEGGKLVHIETFIIPEEASLARGLLTSAEIPFMMENELAPLGGFQIQLLVPEDYVDDAREILEHEITEEELAAQAEAAGEFGEEDEAEEESGEAKDPAEESAGDK